MVPGHRIREAMDSAATRSAAPARSSRVDETLSAARRTRLPQPCRKEEGRYAGRARRPRPFVPCCQRPRQNASPRRYHVDRARPHDRRCPLLPDDRREFEWHGTTCTRSGEYVRVGRDHSNTAENFFSIFKRGVIGTYHHFSEAHLHRYWPSSISATTPAHADAERTAEAISKVRAGKRLTYRRTWFARSLITSLAAAHWRAAETLDKQPPTGGGA